ncbi:putative membrane protein YkvI [Desulfitispora alkaliphila]|uniref:YkvI family membrane protein n=1 Tax=Desulfitispora alkaliphila TaxID=622674 RepID=UPI003D21E58F
MLKGSGNLDKRFLQVAATYMGAIIGAGFASGQELLQFFAIHGNKGLVGIIATGLFFAAIGSLLVLYCHKKGISSYSQLVQTLFGYKMATALDTIITGVLFVGLTVMLVGSGAIFEEQLGLTSFIGIAITVVAVTTALLAGAKGVLLINTLLIPCLVIAAIFVSISVLISPPQLSGIEVDAVLQQKTLVGTNWILASLLYVSYNTILGIVILSSLQQVSLINGVMGTITGGVALGVLGAIKIGALQMFLPSILLFQIPMLFIAGQVAPEIKAVYAIALWFAMVTTAVANAYGIAIRIFNSFKISYIKTVLLVIALPLPFTKFQFSTLVGTLYPIFGYVGIFIVIAVISRITFDIYKIN